MTQPTASAAFRAPRRRSRWWLAGLLVGCLLPVGLVAADGGRLMVRVVQVCWLAPAAIRAESRRQAHRQRWQPPRRPGRLQRRAWPRRRSPWRRWIAALDVLSRRGPPAGVLA
ncbi:hypothetical protein [Halomonas sp. 328]|uniref:hypothetical protein n=1 Tax=Halomonas sp. 328 TaxID=2776704 RepID=UPI0018A70370|nr:hypothetical protein [Halomonas sp. 328]MBF8224057.1 hypothetical protein [Halomonas sp. 328]